LTAGLLALNNSSATHSNGHQEEHMAEVSGTVKWFSDSKGYGFIEPEGGGDDVFAHHSCIQMEGYRTLKQGTKVLFELALGPKGKQAQNIRPEVAVSA
jgi:CspA family cold shock protein